MKFKKTKISPLALLLIAFVVIAGTIAIDTSRYPYNQLPNVVGTSIRTEFDIKTQAGFEIYGAYKNSHGLIAVPTGTEFKVVWQDKSSEKFRLINPYAQVGVVPIPGTQQGPPTAGTGGGGGISSDPGFGGGGGFGGGCRIGSESRQACTSVGGGPQHCETVYVDTVIC